jgi:AhpD family alkylhydroperoxidase
MNMLDQFREHRDKQNEDILACGHIGINRFFNLDARAYDDGALPGRTKELCGLVASAVLRCDDCVTYHLDRCVEAGYTDEELHDALNVALVVGGSVVIPNMRRAFETLKLLREEQ